MNEYKDMYYMLFNSVTDALELIRQRRIESAAELLRQAQQLGEEMYMYETENRRG